MSPASLNQANLKLRLARAVKLASPWPSNSTLPYTPRASDTRRNDRSLAQEETIRDVRFTNPGTLRMLIDAIKTLQQLEQNVNHSDSQTPKPSDLDLLRTVFDFLCGWRSRRVRRPTTSSENVAVFIANNLITILGLPADQFARYLPSPAPLNAQVPVPTAQVPLPTPQVPVPTPREKRSS